MIRVLHFLLLFSPLLMHAAAQNPEKLRIDGKDLPLMATPLEAFWNAAHPRPETLTQTTWACWRGYIGTWEIADNTLTLLRIERHEVIPKADTFAEQIVTIPLQDLFGTNKPVPATWFSGVLRVARGRILAPVNTGYASVYEEDLFLIIEYGRITARRSVKNHLASLTSESDLAWRELGRMTTNGGITAVLPEENLELEKGNWLSQIELILRTKELAKSQTDFEIRGVYLPGKLWFPRLTGPEATYAFDLSDKVTPPTPGVAITATCTLVETATGPRLVASAISELQPGCAIQRRWPSRTKKPNLQESTRFAADSSDSASTP